MWGTLGRYLKHGLKKGIVVSKSSLAFGFVFLIWFCFFNLVFFFLFSYIVGGLSLRVVAPYRYANSLKCIIFRYRDTRYGILHPISSDVV